MGLKKLKQNKAAFRNMVY
jgi:hypothetical protein